MIQLTSTEEARCQDMDKSIKIPPNFAISLYKGRVAPWLLTICKVISLMKKLGRSHCGSVDTNLTGIREDTGSLPGLAHWVKGASIAVSCDVDHRHGSNPAWLWLWSRPAAAAPIRPLAWEPPYAPGVALKIPNKTKKTLECQRIRCIWEFPSWRSG